jgi:uncharacterized protein (DUF2236 family)
VSQKVEETLGDDGSSVRRASFSEPAGDPGWFGPDSVAWRVHSELGPMLIGGFSALMLQTLHPLVMQGVADHSTYRTDPLGRLRRTADFLALTTYGGDEAAREAVREVRRVHRRVRGIGPEGRAYRASDPDLLCYVHVTEVWSFLRAYQRYSGQLLTLEEKNRYLRESSRVARELGATRVPSSTEAVRSYIREVRPQLVRTEAARQAVEFLRKPIGSSPLEKAAHVTLTEAAIGLLPPFARRELGLARPTSYRQLAVRPAATVLSLGLHLILGESPPVTAARRRAAGTAIG